MYTFSHELIIEKYGRTKKLMSLLPSKNIDWIKVLELIPTPGRESSSTYSLYRDVSSNRIWLYYLNNFEY